MWCEKVLVAYDGSSPSHKALEMARRIGKESPDTKFVLAHVAKLYTSGALATGTDTVLLEDTQDIKCEIEAVAKDMPNETSVRILRGSSPADLLVRCAKEEDCDLVIMGSRGQGGVKGYLGSVSYAVVQSSPVCVLIAKDDGQNR